jgi:hypothetical protein
MSWKYSRPRGGVAIAIVLALAGTLVPTSSVTTIAQSAESASGLGGTWIVQVTLRDCSTGAPRAPFISLVTFHRGGTLSESTASPAFAIGQRLPGQGTWIHQAGQTYLQRMIALILFDTPPSPPVSPGFFAGWQEVTHTIELLDASHFTSAGTNAFYRSDGTQYRTGCSTAVGHRFE